MTLDRRKFLRNAAWAASGMTIAGFACSPGSTDKQSGDTTSASDTAAGVGAALATFGLQLYTLRDDMPKDPKGIIKQVAGFGYKELEGYEGPQGMFWNMPHMDFKKYLDDLGLSMVSCHCDTSKDFEKKAAQAAEVGMRYLLSPWIGPQKTVDDYKKYADQFNQLGEVCRKNGIRFAYHNHGYTFTPVDGQMPQAILMDGTDPNLVDFEMDIYWVVTGGADPLVWLEKYPNRFTLCHVKDRIKNADPKDQEASCDLGTGSIDFAKILRSGADRGMKHYIVEQERYDNSTPLKSAEVDAAYLAALRI
jgi:sugar phosphate isomerase/epimerase